MLPTRLGALVLAVALLAGACTEDTAAPSTTTTTTSTATTSPSTASTDAAPATSALPDVDGTFAPGRTPVPGFAEVALRIVPGPDGEPVGICVLVAETPEQRQRGLMGVTDLGGYDGMVFRFPDDTVGAFWMKDTLLPLSIAYLDADGAVVDALVMEPCPPDTAVCPTYPPSGPYRTALEVPAGDLDGLGLAVGSPARVTEAGACPALE